MRERNGGWSGTGILGLEERGRYGRLEEGGLS